MKEKLAKLIDVKSIMTLALTADLSVLRVLERLQEISSSLFLR